MKNNILLTSKELSNYLNVSTTTIYRLKNELPFIKIGNKLLFDKSMIDEWLLKRTHNLNEDKKEKRF